MVVVCLCVVGGGGVAMPNNPCEQTVLQSWRTSANSYPHSRQETGNLTVNEENGFQHKILNLQIARNTYNCSRLDVCMCAWTSSTSIPYIRYFTLAKIICYFMQIRRTPTSRVHARSTVHVVPGWHKYPKKCLSPPFYTISRNLYCWSRSSSSPCCCSSTIDQRCAGLLCVKQ